MNKFRWWKWNNIDRFIYMFRKSYHWEKYQQHNRFYAIKSALKVVLDQVLSHIKRHYGK